MSIVIDCSAALVAPPRARVSLAGARLLADDAQPRLETRSPMPTTAAAWRLMDGSTMRGFELAGAQGTQDGRIASNGAAYVTATTKQHFSTRSGPPTSRPPA